MPSAHLRHAQRELASIEAEIARLTKLADSFRVVIAHYQDNELVGDSPNSPGEDLKDAIERVLELENAPLHPKKIYELLQDRGIHVSGQDPVHNTRSHMSGDNAKRFRSIGDGRWGLRKWDMNGNGQSTIEGIGLPS